MEYLTELCKLAHKYGTDKCPQIKHRYTPVYSKLLEDRRDDIKKVLEFGIGYYHNIKFVDSIYDEQLGRDYYRGASLKMWRDYLPNAQVHGADNVSDTMFEDERITTHMCDYRNDGELAHLIKTIGPDIDLVVDDGSHISENQISLYRRMMPVLSKDTVYVIEDVHINRMNKILRLIKEDGYKYFVPSMPVKRHYDSNLVIVRKNG